MNLFPPTLSSGLRRELSSCYTPDSLFSLLKKDPPKLLAYIGQACQWRNYIECENDFASTVWREVTVLALSRQLPWDSVTKAYHAVLRTFTWPCDLLVKGNGVMLFSRLVFMQTCPVLRDEWMKNPELGELDIYQIAPKLQSLEQLFLLYWALRLNDTSRLELSSLDALFQYALQFQYWGNREFGEKVQTLICKRIVSFRSAIAFLASSTTNQMPLITSHCKQFLDNVRFYYADCEGRDLYMTYCYLMEENPLNEQCSPPEQVLLGNAYMENASPMLLKMKGKLNRIDIAITKMTSALVLCRQIREPEEIYDLACNARKLTRRHLDTTSITHINFNGHAPFSDQNFFGMLYYFTNVDKISIIDYTLLSPLFITLLSEIRPQITTLSFSACLLQDYHFQQTHLLRMLSSLHLFNIEFSARALSFLLLHPALEVLELSCCRFKIPNGLVSNKIRILNMTAVLGISGADINRFLSFFTELKVFYAYGCENFSLIKYPHPDKLETLGVYVRQLESEVDEGERKIGALDRLTALKELIIIGDLSPRLKKVIFPYLKRFKIQFKKAV